MLFKPIVGRSHTIPFQIPSAYHYLRIKYTAILLLPASQPTAPTILVTVVPSNNLRSILMERIITKDPVAASVNCQTNITNRNFYYGTYFID